MTLRKNEKTDIDKIRMETIMVTFEDIMQSHGDPNLNPKNLDITVKEGMGRMVIGLSQRIAALPEKEFIIDKSWPKTWWDAFKERWFPTWAKLRWPIQYETLQVREKIYKCICPHLGTDPTNTHLEWIYRRQRKY